MKTISSIEWTENSIEHIARHGLTPQEVEEACFNEYDAPLIRSGKQNLHYVFGKTYSGRLIFVLVKPMKRGKVNVITARDMNEWERKYSARRGK